MKIFTLFAGFTFLFLATDAQQWKDYLNDGTVTCFATDNDTIWVGMEGGVAKYLIDGTKLANYTRADGLAGNYINSIAIDSQDNKWFSTSFGGNYPSSDTTGVSKFDGVLWTNYYTVNNGSSLDGNNSIAVDTNGNVWVGGNGLSKFDGTSWTNYNTGNSGIPSTGVFSVTLDRKGNLWMLGQIRNQLIKYDGTNWTNMTIDSSSGIWGIISSMAFDKQNNLWLVIGYDGPGSYNGILKFDGSAWSVYGPSNYGFNEVPTSVAIDSQNNKWFAADDLLEFNDTVWTVYSGGGGGNICIDQADNKWLGSLARYDGSNWAVFNPSETGLPSNDVYAIAVDHHGNKWFAVGNSSEVVKFDGVSWSGYPSLSGTGWTAIVSCIAADKTNNIWMGGTYSDVYQYDGTNWQTFNVNANFINVVVDAQNNKWFCTRGRGFLNLMVVHGQIIPHLTVALATTIR